MRIINTADVFISLLGVAICNEKITDNIKVTPDNVENLFEIAKEHSLVEIIGDTLFEHKLMPKCETSDLFRQFLMVSLIKFEKQNYYLNKLTDLFEQSKIPNIALKGAFLKKLYPKPSYRSSVDIDILVKEEDMEKASEILLNVLGFENTNKGNHDWGFKNHEGIYVELHYRLIENVDSKGVNIHQWDGGCLDDVWDNVYLSDDKNYRYEINNEYLYFYHISHMAKHFENGGCGVKPFIDLWLIINKLDFDRNKKDELIKNAGLSKFESAVLDLVNYWFDGGVKSNTTLQIEKFVLSGGVFGNKENYVAVHQTKSGGKFKYALNRIFLPYDFLKVQFPILVKYKWLTPVFQVVRWFESVFKYKRLSLIINEYKINIYSTNDGMDDLLNKLGL